VLNRTRGRLIDQPRESAKYLTHQCHAGVAPFAPPRDTFVPGWNLNGGESWQN
jgi:hypothetical protein